MPSADPDPFASAACLPLSPRPADLAAETLRAVLAHLRAGIEGGTGEDWTTQSHRAGVARAKGIAVEAVVELLGAEGFGVVADLFDEAMGMEV